MVNAELDMNTKPDGLIFHAASDVDDGSVEIVDVYESRDALQRFEQERLFPVSSGSESRRRLRGDPSPASRSST